MTSGTVATLAADLLHSSLSPAELSNGVTVSVPPDSAILDITCRAPSTAACANAFAEAYLQDGDASWGKRAAGSWGMIITVATPSMARR